MGSVIALSNASGAASERYVYSPYGQSNDTSPAGNPYRFTARRLDAETGLYHYRARAYAPLLGRFLQPDPASFVDGLNLYAYVGNDPLNRRDPTGEAFFAGAIIGAIVGAGVAGGLAGLGGAGVAKLGARAYSVSSRAYRAFSTGGNALVGAGTNVGLQIANNYHDPNAFWSDAVFQAAAVGFGGGAAAGYFGPIIDAGLTAATGFGGPGALTGAGIVASEVLVNGAYLIGAETIDSISNYTRSDYYSPENDDIGGGSGLGNVFEYYNSDADTHGN